MGLIQEHSRRNEQARAQLPRGDQHRPDRAGAGSRPQRIAAFVAPPAGWQDRLAGTLARALQQRQGTGLNVALLQRQWNPVPDQEGVTEWSAVIGGLRWRHNAKTGGMAFTIADAALLEPSALLEYRKLEDTWRSHVEWLKMGWGRIEKAKTPTALVELSEAERFKSMVVAGKKRAASARPDGVDPRTLAARHAFFEEYYATKSDYVGPRDEERHDPSKIKLESAYRGTPTGFMERGTGAYSNFVEPGAGKFIADSNYALEGGELYYDPAGSAGVKWGAPGSQVRNLSNSDVIYEQWRRAVDPVHSDYPEFKPQFKRLVRNHVAGDGLAGLKLVLRQPVELAGGSSGEGGARVFGTEDAGYYALLSLPNCIAAVWLVHDYGEALGIRAIDKISASPQKSITIDFA